MAFFHGVKTSEVPTSLVVPREISASIPVFIGCAPIHRVSTDVKSVVLCFTYGEAVQQLGVTENDDFEKWGLSEAAYSQFILYAVKPALFINIFDPTKHIKAVLDESQTVSDNKVKLSNQDVMNVTAIKLNGFELTESDYSLNVITGELLISRDSTVQNGDTLLISYTCADPTQVTASECIGGYDAVTGKSTGIQLVDYIYSMYQLVPGLLLAPGFSDNPSVASILATKASSITGVFKAIAVADLPETINLYTEAPEFKVKNNLVQRDLYLCWPRIQFNGRKMRMATQVAGLIAATDAENDDIPYVSPSNKSLQMQAVINKGDELTLNLDQANYLNSNGIATALNFTGGWKLWGNRTACFPDVTDVKDNFITARRMFGWYRNKLTLTWWQKIDVPFTRRLVETVINSEQITLNSYTAKGYILGGRIEFDPLENSTLDLMNGISQFHVYLGTAAPNEQMKFAVEYDPAYIQTLFG